MRKIFLFESNKDIISLIKNAIQNEFDFEVKNISDIEEALKEISLGDYDLIISRDKIKELDNLTGRFIQVMESSGIGTDIISIGKIETENVHLVGQLPDKFNMSDLIKMIEGHFNSSEKEGEQTYIDVRLEVLELLDKTSFELFSKMSSPGKPDQYRLRFEIDDNIEGLGAFKQKGIKNLFLKKQDRIKFTSNLIRQTSRSLNIDFNDEHSVIKSGERVYRLARKLISETGPNDMSYRLLNCLSDEIIGNLKKNKANISSQLYSTLEYATGYNFKNLNLISAFCFISMPFLDIYEEKKNQYLEHFVYAACFHDILLVKDGMAEIRNKRDLLNCNFSDNDKNLIRDHAKLASELLAKFPGSHPESIQIVKEHHGVPSGIGFTDRKRSTISEPSVFFDVIQEFVEKFINFPPDGSLDTMLKELNESYGVSTYKKYLDILKKGIVDTFMDD